MLPPHPAFDRMGEIFRAAFSRNGADPAIGRRVPELFCQAGLADVEAESKTQMYRPGNTRRTVRLDLVRALRPQIAEMGLASGEELDELDATLRPHLEDPRTVVMSGLLFLVWGRKGCAVGEQSSVGTVSPGFAWAGAGAGLPSRGAPAGAPGRKSQASFADRAEPRWHPGVIRQFGKPSLRPHVSLAAASTTV